jgi:hypothetical protein
MTTKAEPTAQEVAQRLEVVRALYKLMVSLGKVDADKPKPVESK